MKVEDIHLKSEEVQEILGTPPKAIVRWGVTAIFFIIAGLLIMSYIVKYPDIIKGNVTITTKNPPVKITSYATGYVKKILVNDKMKVKAGSILALIESTADYNDVLEIENLILQLDTVQNINSIQFENNRKALGEIQTEFNQFQVAFNALRFFYSNNLEAQTNQAIQGQLNQLKTQNSTLENQKSLLSQELKIKEKQLSERSQLKDKGIISAEEYENFKVTYFQKKQELEQISISISNNSLNQNVLNKDIASNQFTRTYNDNETVMKYNESKDLLMSKINWWKKQYLLTAPIDGQISFEKIWSENQKINALEEIFTLIPDKNEVIAKIYIPISGISKVKKNQKIMIQLANYPVGEFGYLESKVDNIALIPNENKEYLVESALPDKLITSYKKTLEFKTEMQGSANIVASKKRIITRIFEKFRTLIHA